MNWVSSNEVRCLSPATAATAKLDVALTVQVRHFNASVAGRFDAFLGWLVAFR